MAEIVIDIRSNNATSRLSSLRSEFERTDKSINSTTRSVGVLNKGIVGLVGAIGGLYGVKSAFDSIQTGFKTLETASLEVSKTTGLVGDDLKRLTDELDNMSTTMGGFEVKGLYAIAESAGQLGIKGVDNLKQFTKEMQYMASSSKLTAEEASTGFAEIANALNLPIKDINKLTSSFSKLASTTTADEAKLLDFTQRLAGAGKTLGLTNAEIVAVGATMKDVGVNVEVGGTAMSQVFAKMLKDTEQFAKVSNMELSEYSKMIDDKPVKALETFLESLGKLDKRAKIQALDDMKLSGSGLSSTLLKLSTNTEKLNANIKTSSEAYIYGKATQDEYAVASESLANQQTKTESAMLLLKKAIGDELKPMMISLNDTTVDAIKWTQENTDTLKTAGVAIGIATTSYLVLTNGVRAYNTVMAISTTLGVVKNLSNIDRVVVLASASYRTLTKATVAYNVAMRATPWGLAITGATLLGTALYNLFEVEKRRAKLTADISQKVGTGDYQFNKDGMVVKSKTESLKEYNMALGEYDNNLKAIKNVENILKTSSSLSPKAKEALEKSIINLKAKSSALKENLDYEKESAKFEGNTFETIAKKAQATKGLASETEKLNKEIDKLGKGSNGTSPTTSISKGIDETARLLKEFGNDYNRATMDRTTFQIHQLDIQKKAYLKNGMDRKKVDEWYVAETSKISNEAQKQVTESAKREQAERDRIIKSSIEKEERLAKEQSEKLKRFDDVLNRSTMDSFDYKIKKLDEEKAKYQDIGAEKVKIDAWYSSEFEKIENERISKIEADAKKVADIEKSRIAEIEKAEKKRDDTVAKSWEDANARFKQDFEEQQSQRAKELDGLEAYYKLTGQTKYAKEIEYQKKSLWYKERGIDLSAKQIEQLEMQQKLYATIAGYGKQILSDYAKTGDISQSVQNFSDSDTLGESMRSSDSFWGQVIGYGSQLLSGAGTSGESEFEALQADINSGNTDIVDALSASENAIYSHLSTTKEMKNSIDNLGNNIKFASDMIVHNGGDFASGKSFTATQSWHTGEEDLGINISGGAVGRRIIDNALTEWVEELDNSLTRQLMGETTRKLKDAGVTFGEQTAQAFVDDLTGGYYQEIAKKKTGGFGLYSSTSTSTKTQDFDAETKQSLEDAMANSMAIIAQQGMSLGLEESNIKQSLNEHIVKELKISTKDLEEGKISDKISEWLGSEMSKMAEEALPEITKDFKLGDESSLATLSRVTTSFADANYSLYRLGMGAVEFTDILNNADLAMVNTDTSAYIAGFKTEQQQINIMRNDLHDEFKSVGLVAPKTVEEMNNLVDGLDRSNPKWIEQYDTIMRNAGAVTSYIDAVDAQAEAEKQRLDDIAEAESKATKEAEDLVKTLARLGDVVASATLETKTYIDKRGMDTLEGIEYDKDKIVKSLGLDYIEEITVDSFDVVIDSWREAHAEKVAITEAEEASVKALSSVLIAEDKEIRSIEEQRAKDAVTRAEETAREIKEIELFYQSDRLESYKIFYDTFGMDDEQKIIHDMKKTNNIYIESLKAVGLESITGATYIDRYAYALENGLTTEQIEKWNALGDAIENSANANSAYTDSLIASMDAITSKEQEMMDAINADIETTRGTLESLIRGEIDTIQKDFDDRNSEITSLQESASKYNKTTNVSSIDVYTAIGRWDGTDANADIESMIDSYVSSQKEAFDKNIEQQKEAEKLRVEIANKDIDTKNEAIKLNNQLHDQILKMKESVESTFLDIRTDTTQKAEGNLKSAIANKDYDNIGSAFSKFSSMTMDGQGTEIEKLLRIAYANRDIQSIAQPEEQTELEHIEATVFDMQLDTDSINQNAKGMMDALIATNNSALPNVETKISELWAQNKEYFESGSDFYNFMERGATEETFMQQSEDARKQLDIHFKKNLDFAKEVQATDAMFQEIQATNYELQTSMLDRHFDTSTRIADRLQVNTSKNESEILQLKRALTDLTRKFNDQATAQTALLQEIAKTNAETATNTNTEEGVVA